MAVVVCKSGLNMNAASMERDWDARGSELYMEIEDATHESGK